MRQISLDTVFIRCLSLCSDSRQYSLWEMQETELELEVDSCLMTSVSTAMLLDKYHLGEEIWDSSVATQWNCEFQNHDFPMNLTFLENK